MSKNIVVCCDGTNNKLTINENTNVLHLYSCLIKDAQQITYYHPGVGTILPGTIGWIKKKYYKLLDAVSAISLENHVAAAYRFLMDHYEKGDKIYIFGFSRGAYVARMICGIIQLYGLLDKGNHHHLDYIFQEYYTGEDTDWKLANKFKSRFSKSNVNVEFLGIWDTVVSVGGLFKSYHNFPFTSKLKSVKIVRHAVSIDERRKHFKHEAISTDHPNGQEVYFAGVHSNIGGGYPEEGLSKISLEWMLGEASAVGLKLDSKKVDRYVLGIGKAYQKKDYTMPVHDSLRDDNNWKLDFIPRLRNKFIKLGENDKTIKKSYYDWSFWSWRQIPEGANIHHSVFDKLAYKTKSHHYAPENLLTRDLNTYQKVFDKAITYQK